MKTAIIVDSTAYLSDELAEHADVYQVNLSVTFSDGAVGPDSRDQAGQLAFYHRLVSERQLPTTSQPVPGDYYDVLDEIVAKGYDVVYCIHMSSGISGTFQTAKMITSEYQDRLTIFCIDSKGASVLMEGLVQQTLRLSDSALTPDEIYDKLLWVAQNSRIYLMVEDLNNLVKGGRLSAAAALVGGMLKVRPVLMFDAEGKIVVYEKIRTNKRVYQCWLKLAHQAIEDFPDGIDISFAHSAAYDEINSVKDVFQKHLPEINFRISGLGPVVGTHTGAGTKGFCFIPIAKI